MEWLNDIWASVSVSAIVQIAILYFVIYAILRYAKGSRFGQVLMGVGILAAIMIAFTYVFHFDVLSVLVRSLLFYLAISTVVIFQPEIRRVLSQVGAFGFFERSKYAADGSATPEFIVQTIVALADRRIGALIAFERGISLRGYEDTGVATDAMFSRELVQTIFTPPLPLHDGGVTIRNGRIAAAHCVFPVSNNPELITSGMRHRAAVGLSEETDALVIAVSEETGSVSVAHNGKLIRYTGEQRAQSLIRWVAKAMPNEASSRGRLFSSVVERLTSRKGRSK
ncbi:MAG: diadenylate cyclase CdaA [Kiritimatiellae bacterium]|nr:diadenylate cyclase CdaA [Kiritimatiellia bacterium]